MISGASDLFPSAPISTEALVECVDRELGFRRRVYPRHVAAGKLTQDTADRQLALMEAVRERLVQSDDWRRRLAEFGVTI